MNESAGVSGAEDFASRGRVEFFGDLQMVAEGPHRCGHCKAELHGVKPLVASKESEARVAALREALDRELDPLGTPGLTGENLKKYAEIVDLLHEREIPFATVPDLWRSDGNRVLAVIQGRAIERGVRLRFEMKGECTVVITLLDADGGGA